MIHDTYRADVDGQRHDAQHVHDDVAHDVERVVPTQRRPEDVVLRERRQKPARRCPFYQEVHRVEVVDVCDVSGDYQVEGESV